MDAPTYPPAASYVEPEWLPRTLNTRETPITVLQANPEAWAIVMKELPGVERRIGSVMIRPHLGNFSIYSLIQFGPLPEDAVERADEQLRALGEFP